MKAQEGGGLMEVEDILAEREGACRPLRTDPEVDVVCYRGRWIEFVAVHGVEGLSFDQDGSNDWGTLEELFEVIDRDAGTTPELAARVRTAWDGLWEDVPVLHSEMQVLLTHCYSIISRSSGRRRTDCWRNSGRHRLCWRRGSPRRNETGI